MITAKEATKKYKVSRMSLYTWTLKGLLKVQRVIQPNGRTLNLYDENEIIEAVKMKGKYKPSKNGEVK